MKRLATIFTFVLSIILLLSGCNKESHTINGGFSVSIPNNTSVVGFKGIPIDLSFSVSGPSASSVNARLTRREGLTADLAFNNKNGVITLICNDDKGGFAEMVMSNDDNVRFIKITMSIYEFGISAFPQFSIDNPADCKAANYKYAFDKPIPIDIDNVDIATSVDWLNCKITKDSCFVSLTENLEGSQREGIITIQGKDNSTQPLSLTFIQGTTEQVGIVMFKDSKLKEACLEVADSNGDKKIQFQEAKGIKELNISGRGISDLTGIEHFTSLEKLVFTNNNVKNADMLTNLPQLHWLEMEKNPLESFDVHGCQTVFTRCWFDNTISNMGFYEPCCKYTVMQNQVNVSAICDPNRYGCTIIPYQPKSSNKEQTDTKLHLLRKHTKGDGIPLILYAIGMTDKEIEDGNYKRLIDVMFDGFVNGTKTVSPSKYTEFMDIYYINVVSPDRNWEFPKYEWPTEFEKIEPLYRENLKEFYNQEELEKISKDITYLGHAVGTTLSIEKYNSNSDSNYMWELLPVNFPEYSKPYIIYSNGHSNTTREMQMKGYGDETLFSVTYVNEITNESCEDLVLNAYFGHLVDYVSPY